MAPNIYYHFFDRELRQSINAKLTDIDILKIIYVSIFMSDNGFYLPISNLYESSQEFPISIEFIKKLDQIGLIYPASSHKSVESFLVSRQYLYNHDKDRYPMYFGIDNNIWSSNLVVLRGSTTEILRNKFILSEVSIPEFSDKNRNSVKKLIQNTVSRSNEKAVTFSLFKGALAKQNFNNAEAILTDKYIRRSISIFYTQRYLESEEGTIITGIPQISEYDFLAESQFDTNYCIYSKILERIGLDICSCDILDIVLNIRLSKIIFESIYDTLKRLISALSQLFNKREIGYRKKLIEYLHSEKKLDKVSDDISLYRNLNIYINDICSRNQNLRLEINKMNEYKKSLVIVAVTDIEMKELFESIKKYCEHIILVERISGNLVYRELVGCKFPVYIVQSQMGALGAGSIINTIHKVYKELNPDKVVMGGIAFGSNPEKQEIGDILVSQQVWSYEPAKIKDEDIIGRGDKVSASSFLLQLFHSSALEYINARVHFGLFASGEKLINSEELMSQLKGREKEIIGGEMEAAGLASVCSDNKIEWIVVKAICDWGFKKDDSNQQLAAHNAFDFIMYNLKKIII